MTAIKGIVHYENLGRGKAKGTIQINCETEDEFNQAMYSEFSKHLMSDEISWDKGKIYAGMRSVGEFNFIATKDEGATA